MTSNAETSGVPTMHSSTLLQRMKKLVEEQDHLLDVELKKQQEYEDSKNILETSAYKRMAAIKMRSNKLVRDDEETRQQESGRTAAEEEKRE